MNLVKGIKKKNKEVGGWSKLTEKRKIFIFPTIKIIGLQIKSIAAMTWN